MKLFEKIDIWTCVLFCFFPALTRFCIFQLTLHLVTGVLISCSSEKDMTSLSPPHQDVHDETEK